jgi:hypothetical protein
MTFASVDFPTQAGGSIPKMQVESIPTLQRQGLIAHPRMEVPVNQSLWLTGHSVLNGHSNSVPNDLRSIVSNTRLQQLMLQRSLTTPAVANIAERGGSGVDRSTTVDSFSLPMMMYQQQQHRQQGIDRIRHELQMVQLQNRQRTIESAIRLALLQQSMLEGTGMPNRMQHNRDPFATQGRNYESLFHDVLNTGLSNASYQVHRAPVMQDAFSLTTGPIVRARMTGNNSNSNTTSGVNGMNTDMRSTYSSASFSIPALLARPNTDHRRLSEFQCLLRQQIVAFEANDDDVMTHVRGRNKPVTHGQVGLRCKHCGHLPVSCRQKGSTYFPSNKMGIYQAAQNMSTTHIQNGVCGSMPDHIKQQFAFMINNRHGTTNHGAGRLYWSKSASHLGLVDTEHHGIRFLPNLPSDAILANHEESKVSK